MLWGTVFLKKIFWHNDPWTQLLWYSTSTLRSVNVHLLKKNSNIIQYSFQGIFNGENFKCKQFYCYLSCSNVYDLSVQRIASIIIFIVLEASHLLRCSCSLKMEDTCFSQEKSVGISGIFYRHMEGTL